MLARMNANSDYIGFMRSNTQNTPEMFSYQTYTKKGIYRNWHQINLLCNLYRIIQIIKLNFRIKNFQIS